MAWSAPEADDVPRDFSARLSQFRPVLASLLTEKRSKVISALAVELHEPRLVLGLKADNTSMRDSPKGMPENPPRTGRGSVRNGSTMRATERS